MSRGVQNRVNCISQYNLFALSLLCLGKCEESLATPLPYSSFSASTLYGGSYGAGYAKLNRRGGIYLLFSYSVCACACA